MCIAGLICIRLPRQHRCALQKVKKAIYRGKYVEILHDTTSAGRSTNVSLSEYYQTNFILVSDLQCRAAFPPHKSAPKSNVLGCYLCFYPNKLGETRDGFLFFHLTQQRAAQINYTTQSDRSINHLLRRIRQLLVLNKPKYHNFP